MNQTHLEESQREQGGENVSGEEGEEIIIISDTGCFAATAVSAFIYLKQIHTFFSVFMEQFVSCHQTYPLTSIRLSLTALFG